MQLNETLHLKDVLRKHIKSASSLVVPVCMWWRGHQQYGKSHVIPTISDRASGLMTLLALRARSKISRPHADSMTPTLESIIRRTQLY